MGMISRFLRGKHESGLIYRDCKVFRAGPIIPWANGA